MTKQFKPRLAQKSQGKGAGTPPIWISFEILKRFELFESIVADNDDNGTLAYKA